MGRVRSVCADIKERKARWRALLKPSAEPGFMFFVNCNEVDDTSPKMPPRWPSLQRERIDAAYRSHEAQCRRAELIPDDRVPYLDNVTGTEIFAEALGCRVERRPEEMPFAVPFVRTAAEAERVTVPELSTSSLSYLFEIADELQRRCGKDAVQKLVDIQSPMGIIGCNAINFA